MTVRAAASFAMRWRRCLAVACLCCAAGCNGRGRIELASLDYREIDPPAGPPPRVGRVELDCCYWWTDKDGQLWIAMQRQQTPLFNPEWRFQFQLSLVLEKLPAGPALDYKVTRNTLRTRVRVGPWESRFTSRTGIIALYRESNDRLRGSLRLEAARVASRWLGGWSRPSRYLMLGSFVAVHDEQRGGAIVAATESAGWGRDAPARARRAPARAGPESKPAAPTASAPAKP